MVAQENLNVALIQIDLLWENVSGNLLAFEKEIAKCDNADLIVLPEMFSSGFSMDAQTMATYTDETIAWMGKQAAKQNAVVCGSIIAEEDGRFFNRFIWMLPSGEWSSYDKRHLFTMGGEHNVYASGNRQKVFAWKGWRIAPFVCYDLRFPVWSRNKNHFDLMIYVANWPAARDYVWETLLKARAIENQCCVAACNRIGKDGKGVNHLGNSMCINAKGEVIGLAGKYKANTVTATFSRSELMAFREKFPVLLDGDNFSI